MASAVEKEAVVQDALTQRAGAFGDPLAGDVLDGRDARSVSRNAKSTSFRAAAEAMPRRVSDDRTQ